MYNHPLHVMNAPNPNSNAARMRIITARFGIEVGSTAFLALGGITPARSFHLANSNNHNHNHAAGPTTAAFQGAAAPWATCGRSRARTTRSAANGVGRVGAGQTGAPQWGGGERGRARRLADRRCVGLMFRVFFFGWSERAGREESNRRRTPLIGVCSGKKERGHFGTYPFFPFFVGASLPWSLSRKLLNLVAPVYAQQQYLQPVLDRGDLLSETAEKGSTRFNFSEADTVP